MNTEEIKNETEGVDVDTNVGIQEQEQNQTPEEEIESVNENSAAENPDEEDETSAANEKNDGEEKENLFKFKKDKDNKKDEEIALLKDQLMRSMAEYDNYRKRTAKEKLELEPEITAKIAAEFLPVVDSVERALQHECTDANYKKGVEMIYQSFMDTLGKIGVEQIDTEGADFNPAYHQAVQQVQSEDTESGKIVSTFQKGYKIGNKILRFAMVSVAE